MLRELVISVPCPPARGLARAADLFRDIKVGGVGSHEGLGVGSEQFRVLKDSFGFV